MILTLFVIFLITLGGAALTFLYQKDDLLLARLAAGGVVGSAIFATIGFTLACFFGLSAATVLASLVLTLTPLLLLAKKDYREKFKREWQRAKGKLQGANLAKFTRFAFYVGVFLLLWLFFERAMIVNEKGILTGGSQNLGDLPFHLGAIFSFTEGSNFPPENPSFANAKFTYPFLADFVTACFVALGAAVRDAMLVQNVLLGFSLVVLLEKFTVRLTGSRLAGKIAPALLLLSGGLGFVWFFRDAWNAPQGFFEFLWKLPNDYTIGEIASTKTAAEPENFRWGNSLVVLFLTQRSLLFGLPLALVALIKIWEIFATGNLEKEKERKGEEERRKKGEKEKRREGEKERDSNFQNPEIAAQDLNHAPSLPFSFSPFLVGLLAGMLPLIHVHSLVVLFVVCAFLFFFRTEEKWRAWIAFAAGVALIAVPELVFVMTGSASNLKEFIGWHFGWDAGKQNFVIFWAKNIGLFIPLLLVGLYLIFSRSEAENSKNEKPKTENRKPKTENLLIFYLPFAFLFLVSNTIKLAPWEWDNIKVLIYWFVASLPFAAYFLAWAWQKDFIFKTIAAVCFLVLTLSGALDVWRTVSGQINYQIFSRDALKIAEQIKAKTPPKALFLNAPTYNSAVVLTGRRSVMRYSGHLSSYGIDYLPREREVEKIYEGGALADRLLQKNGVEYVIISPEERANLAVNEEFFDKFPIIAESGEYRIYKVK